MKNMLAFLIVALFSINAVATCDGVTKNDVFITEYVEGSSSNRAIELTNMSDSEIDLGALGYKLKLHNNGQYAPLIEQSLSQVLAPCETFVYYNSNSSQDLLDFVQDSEGENVNSEASNVTAFNGSATIVLTKLDIDNIDITVDSIGQIGRSNLFAWNVTLRRETYTQDKNLNNTWNNNKWMAFASDTFDGLGCVGLYACPVTEDDSGANFPPAN